MLSERAKKREWSDKVPDVVPVLLNRMYGSIVIEQSTYTYILVITRRQLA